MFQPWTRCSPDFTNSNDEMMRTGSRSNSTSIEQIDFVGKRSFEFADDRDDRPTVGANVRVLYPAISIRGNRRRLDSGDRQTWNSKVCARTQDTRFIQVQVARVATLRPVWSSISRPALGVVPRRDCLIFG
jgi:hypothetical protein